jgi:hypothetical protein
MERPEEEAREHLVARVLEALAEDPRVGEVELDVRLLDETIVVSGTVSTRARRDAISSVLTERFPGQRVDNRTGVPPLGEPEEAERLT